MRRLLRRVGLWLLDKTATETITAALADGQPRVVVVIFVSDPPLVPGLIYGAMHTYCLAHGLESPAAPVEVQDTVH